MIDNCLGITAIRLGITGVGILSTIVAAPAIIEMESESIVMGLLRVVENRETKILSLKIEKHEQIAILAVSALNTINSLMSKALSDDSNSDEQYSIILLEFETFTRMKEDLRIKSEMSFEKTGDMEAEGNELRRGNKIGVPTWVHVQNHVRKHVQNHAQNHVQSHVQNHAQNHFRKNKIKLIKICHS